LKKLILIIFLITNTTYAKAWDFSKVQPIDNKAKETLKWDNDQLADTISDWSLYALLVMPALDTLNEDKVLVRLCAYGASHWMSSSITQFVKTRANRVRPNGKSEESFFSGHTSAAFTSASFVCATDSNRKCIAGIALASTTGYLRIAGNKHWMSDVLVGAFVGYGLGQVVPIYIFGF
jgi:membrane-associated phospholipid phosphatase